MTALDRSDAQPAGDNPVGDLLRYWRNTRHLSQLALAHEADVSPRHVCFLETGRSRPSRDMVLRLAATLEVPLRERNALLLAAGFAPLYTESAWSALAESGAADDGSVDDGAELAAVRRALAAILEQQEPFPAVVMNRRWDLLDANAGAGRFFAHLLGSTDGGDGGDGGGSANVLRLMFDPDGLRPYVANWRQVAPALLDRVTREAVGGVLDDATHELLDEIHAFPGVPAEWRHPARQAPQVPVLPVSFEKDGRRYDFFSTVTVLGTPQDVTLQELRIECFFPCDEATRAHAEELARQGSPAG